MPENKGYKLEKAIITFILAGLLVADFLAAVAEAIPVFARRYEISCAVCHTGFPQLNGFGASFARNGYQFPEEDLSDRLVDTGDEKLMLLKNIPLAVRADSFFRVRNDTRVNSDFETPFGIKLLSSAPLKKDISYYFYFFIDERGDVAGIEDAFIYFNNGYKDVDLDLRVGQFQASDILFPREQRLTFQDFTYYVTAVSDSNFKLTYDRIVELSYNFDLTEEIGMGVTVAVANGNGIGQADSDRNFDSDDFKNFFGKISFETGGNSFGIYGYSGREQNTSRVRNEFFRVGPDFNFSLFDGFNLWGNFLYGEDSNPRFSLSAGERLESWGGFAGATWLFKEDWILSFLYNRVEVYGKGELDANTMTANLTYYLMRNFKLMAEVTADLETTGNTHPEKEHTGILGIVLAF